MPHYIADLYLLFSGFVLVLLWAYNSCKLVRPVISL